MKLNGRKSWQDVSSSRPARPGKINNWLSLLVNLSASGSGGVTTLVVLHGKLPGGMVFALHHWRERVQKTVGSGEVMLKQLLRKEMEL